jgi:hypothetical protein
VNKVVLGGGTTRVMFFMQYQGLQPTDDKIKVSDVIANDLGDATALPGAMRHSRNRSDPAGPRCMGGAGGHSMGDCHQRDL